ncbi:helix-turn-helix domain-containing protein [Arthrobacter russicus]
MKAVRAPARLSKEHHLSQDTVATEAGMSRGYYALMESGYKPVLPHWVLPLADALGCPPELFGIDWK